MIPTKKKYLILLVLLAYVIWPMVHAAGVYLYDMNPWKFFGFAMYCVPPPGLTVLLTDVSTAKRVTLAPPEVFERDSDRRNRFLAQRLHTGSLLAPDVLADQVFAEYPGVMNLEIVMVHRVFDLNERKMVTRRYGYRYARAPTRTRLSPP
jgi:hypothetical protein